MAAEKLESWSFCLQQEAKPIWLGRRKTTRSGDGYDSWKYNGKKD